MFLPWVSSLDLLSVVIIVPLQEARLLRLMLRGRLKIGMAEQREEIARARGDVIMS